MILACIAYPSLLHDLATDLNCPNIVELCRRFVYDQVNDDPDLSSADVDLDDCPEIANRVRVFTSAATSFFAPSELAGWRGMHRELIRCTDSWHGEYSRYDTVLIQMDYELEGFPGMYVGRVFAFLELVSAGVRYPCALIQWFDNEEAVDNVTGMWVVEPEFEDDGSPSFGVVSLDSIVRACHLVPVYGNTSLPKDFEFSYSLDTFHSFYLNHYIDYHSHEIL